MDFYRIGVREIERGPKKGTFEIYPDWQIGRSKDLMIRGRSFYAIWDEEIGLWSTDEYDVQRLVDEDLQLYADKHRADSGIEYSIRSLRSHSSQSWSQFRKFIQNISDNSHDLDNMLTFQNTEVKKTDYASRRLPYSLVTGDYSAWDELVGTLYSVEERAKIEWAIGAVISGDARKIQKFLVLYGPAGTGKSTILNVIQKMFPGYITTFDAKALGSSNASFSTEVFKNNPLVAIQHDGDLSRIEDNTKLNSIVSHEDMPMNEKYKASYTSRVNAILLMGTNQPVKISDAKSGIIRRLIDVHPTGVIIPENHYNTLMSQIDFELGAIAQHCLDVYREMGKNYYTGYRPLEMMYQTDVFFNFIEANFDIFKQQDSTTLRQAYVLYKEFCNDTGIERPLPQYKIREELRNYFDEFHERLVIDGEQVRSVYSGFNANKFKAPTKESNTFSLVIEETESILDTILAEQPAQYHKMDEYGNEIPAHTWVNVRTRLADLDTSRLHYVRVPESHIVIDFDLKDLDGNKSLERNLEAASNWPATYAELSKGGNGVHLHYAYDGDVSELAGVYSDGIEVKTLLGNSSLRRRLTKCNNVPIAVLGSGVLPKKEKKVLNGDKIRSERGLRALIERNLRKEIMPSTKSSVDFIQHILDEAYDSGMQYDVSDMKGQIISFASNSSNQALQCLKIVQQMKFQGNDTIEQVREFEPPPEEEPAIKETPLVFWDLEVYPNLIVLCWKYQGDHDMVRMINPTAKDVEPLLKMKLVGFNCRRYDNHILYAIYMGYSVEQIYDLSQRIINNDRNAMFAQAYGLSYTDIYDFLAIKNSLKKLEIELGILHMELDLPWDKPVPKELIPKVVEYCCNDVMATEEVFEAKKQDFVARQILADLSGLTVNDTTAKHTAKIIFGSDRNPQSKFVYTDLREMFDGYDFDRGVSTYRGEVVGEGGYVYAEKGMYENVVLLDIASMHPTSIEQLNLFGEYTPRFSALKEARLAIKYEDYDTAGEMLNGALKPYLTDKESAGALSDALKIVINSVYGLTSAKFDNPFRDPRNYDNIVAKRGALFMIDLKHHVQEVMGLQVVHIKTDSIKIPNATQEQIDEISAFGAKYGYTFEHEATYDKFCLVNDAVYIARYGWAAKQKKIGKWEAVGAQFQHSFVFKSLFSGEDPTFDDLCEPRSVIQGAMYLDFKYDQPDPEKRIDEMQFVGKTGLFVPVSSEIPSAALYRVKDGKIYAVAGTKGHLWLEADKARTLDEDLIVDMGYFDNLLESAVRSIEQFGDFKKFVNG